MTSKINATTTNGIVHDADNSGVLELQSNGASCAKADGSNFQMNSGYGSVATVYGCRAWVNFNGTGTVAIRGSGNVSSITDNGVGDYKVNFTTAMPDANFGWAGSCSNTTVGSATAAVTEYSSGGKTTSSLRVYTGFGNTLTDYPNVQLAIFR